jgi:tetratricopeptide (TPR) repeat protein
MLRMVDRLNTSVLAEMPARSDPPVRMDCVHCHRGSPTPRTLASELSAVIAAQGPAAAVQHYRDLRENMANGRFDFGEWSINELARSLAEQGNTGAAIAMLEMNAEYYPRSVSIDLQLGALHRGRGEREQAIARYRLALEKDPANAQALQALKDLGGGD